MPPWVEKWGEAMKLIELTGRKQPNVTTAEAIIPLIDHLKQGVRTQPCS